MFRQILTGAVLIVASTLTTSAVATAAPVAVQASLVAQSHDVGFQRTDAIRFYGAADISNLIARGTPKGTRVSTFNPQFPNRPGQRSLGFMVKVSHALGRPDIITISTRNAHITIGGLLTLTTHNNGQSYQTTYYVPNSSGRQLRWVAPMGQSLGAFTIVGFDNRHTAARM